MSQTNRFISILENSLIGAHGFILILLVGQEYIVLPAILKVFGRMHPLLLHFPIVLLLIGVLLILFPKILTGARNQENIKKIVLLLGLVFTAFTIIAGLFLSAEPGYARADIQNHQWTGMSVFWIGTILYWGIHKDYAFFNKAMAGCLVACILVTGHLGASLTHGDDFLWSPLASNEVEKVSLDQALAYEHVIKPILEQKCVSCHKASKQKGDLRLDEPNFILAGGESGKVLDFAEPENSSLIQRILLPLAHDDHMPPKGKNQLTQEEIQILQAWVKDSVSFEKRLVQYEEQSEFYQLAQYKFKEDHIAYSFPAADSKVVSSLNSFYRKVEPIYPQSPALRVSFFGKNNFNPETFKDLTKIKEQVVELNLSNMPLKDGDLKHLASFPNLEKVNLNFTEISGSTIEQLKDLKHLKNLSLTGNALVSSTVPSLAEMDQLEFLYLWNTGLSEKDYEELKSKLLQTKIEIGYQDDGTLYVLNPPKLEYEDLIFSDQTQVSLRHPINNVKLFYTLDNTLPDSSNHLVYEKPIQVAKSSTLRVRAFAVGWLGSQEASAVFLKAGLTPDHVSLQFEPNEKYKGKGTATLFDQEKGNLDFGSGKWLGFQDHPFDLNVKFDNPKDIESIGFSLFTDESSHIFAPTKIEIWVKSQGGEWKKTHQELPQMPSKANGKSMVLKEFALGENQVLELRARLQPVNSLPKWHPGASQKGWVFIDEVMIN